ncbi:MAG: hypothetical protein NT141_03410 [candidate division WWE3 bacterium]|nr:hypothetical protein [candidate division WWE3 bacterium]
MGHDFGSDTHVCKNLIATDISSECLEKARIMYPEIRFEVLDAFNTKDALKLGDSFTKIYIDMSGISGYRSVLDALALLNNYATLFEPEAIIIKSGSIKNLAAHLIPWPPCLIPKLIRPKYSQ